MTPMADLFVNIHNESAYANSSTQIVQSADPTSDVQPSDWYMEVSGLNLTYIQLGLR